jgi:AraC-like DNA-binding protein
MPPVAALGDVVESLMDWEVSDRRMTVSLTALPSTAPLLCVHYRSTAWSNRRRSAGYYRQIVAGIQTEAAAIRAPGGPLGVVATRLRPEAASRLIGSSLQELTDSSVAMRDLFGDGPVSVLEERLAEADSSLERVQQVEAFLLPRLRANELAPAMQHAVRSLRDNPTLSGRVLAAQLDISERHLSRSFRSIFGISPKQFARIARIGKIVRARWNGGAWADIAHTMGFFDQAHMINDFKSMVGVTPAQLFCEVAGRNAALNTLFGRSPFSNFLVTCDFNILAPGRDRDASRPALADLR